MADMTSSRRNDGERGGNGIVMQGPPWAVQRNGHNGAGARSAADLKRIARALGWLSLGLGITQIAAPQRVAQAVGFAGNGTAQKVVRAIGLREVVSGIGLLMQEKPTPWLWSRVGGDAMDLALLGSAMVSPKYDRGRVAAATAAVMGIAAADALCSKQMTTAAEALPAEAPEVRDVHSRAAITVNAPGEEVYRLWDGFQALPRFMGDSATVEITGDRQSRWRLAAPAGRTLSWDVEITESRANEEIAWRTVAGMPVSAEGTVRFRPAPGERGTEIVFEATFRPPGGEVGRMIGSVFAEALGTKLANDLRRFKQLVEVGEIVKSDDSIVPGPNPAQPSGKRAAT
jgi:uncharacterized membrane protein